MLTALALSGCAHQLVPFDAALINARADSKMPAAEQWEIETAPEMIPKLAAAMEACDPMAVADGERFTLVVRLATEGEVLESVVEPSTKLSECFRETISGAGFPSAPWQGYWLEIEMHRIVD